VIFTAIYRYRYRYIGIGIVRIAMGILFPIEPPHRAETIEQTVIGQFQFMSMRRTRERFVRPLKEEVGGFVEGSMGVKGYYQHLYLVVAPTMSNVACYGPQMWLPKA